MNSDTLKDSNDNPGVYVPPPLLYVAVFVAAVFLQRTFPIDKVRSMEQGATIIGFIFVAIALLLVIISLRQFFVTKNSLITIRPAFSLQTNGIYRFTRNPMYLGLANIYLAVTCFIGSWWNIILFPLLIIIVHEYIIKREERYLTRRFGQVYLNYKNRVRRWI
jgi:protein-S-isoprenylcysteine O-methyltransferase Ste14